MLQLFEITFFSKYSELFENKRGGSKETEIKENTMFSILKRVKKDAGNSF